MIIDGHKRVRMLAAVSIFVGCAVLALKYVAYLVTGSAALYSDAIESIANVATAIVALLAIWISSKPADAGHPYGHSKVEYFAAVFEGIVIIAAALAIIHQAWIAFHAQKVLDAPVKGLLINLGATILNALWSWVLVREGRRLRSPALVADGRHILTDLWTSGGVIVGVALIALTGWLILDPLIAALMALNVIWSGFSLMHESIDGLMDRALPKGDLERVRAIIESNMSGATEAHDVRTRHAGRMIFIDFHLIVDGKMTVETAHKITDRIEVALRKVFPETITSIHVEPPGKSKGGDAVAILGSGTGMDRLGRGSALMGADVTARDFAP